MHLHGRLQWYNRMVKISAPEQSCMVSSVGQKYRTQTVAKIVIAKHESEGIDSFI